MCECVCVCMIFFIVSCTFSFRGSEFMLRMMFGCFVISRFFYLFFLKATKDDENSQ